MNLLPYIIPALLTFIAGLALWTIQKQRLVLVYKITESGIFPIASSQAKYFILELKNKGNQPIENCNFSVEFEQGVISNFIFSDDNLAIELVKSESLIQCKIPLLNPREVLKTTITIQGNPQISNPKVNARATGVTAKLETDEDYTTIINYAIPIIAISITLGFAGSSVISLIFPSSDNKIISEITRQTRGQLDSIKTQIDTLRQSILYQPDREDIIFSILNKAGLNNIFAKLISSRDEISYRITGYYLFYRCFSDESNRAKYLDAMNQIVSVKEIVPGSKSLIYYLMSKLEQNYGRNDKAMQYLEECKKTAPEMYSHLMDQDVNFDIKSIKKWIPRDW